MADPNRPKPLRAGTRDRLVAEIAQTETRLHEIEDELVSMRARLAELRALLETAPSGTAESRDRNHPEDELAVPGDELAVPGRSPESGLDPGEKVALFRTLFAGRTDVFPRFWRNQRTGREGYSPACENEWVRGVCDKPRIKCGTCPNQAFLPVTDRVVLDHLQGRHVIGVYPMLDDETCGFLAADFDRSDWKADVSAFVATCHGFGLRPAVERSRSGNGAHVWLFFAVPVSAATARRMGSYLLTETMNRRPELSMGSYDRLFPNQDTMPKGGFGNLIALPLQYHARKEGNTVFVDDQFDAHADQWRFLASVPRIDSNHVTRIVEDAARRGPVLGVVMPETETDLAPDAAFRVAVPSTARGELPATVRVILDRQVQIEKTGLPPAVLTQLRRAAAFPNPEFHKKQSMRLSTALTPRIVDCSQDHQQHLGLPRGCLSDVRRILASEGVDVEIEDLRSEGAALDVSFHGELTPIQEQMMAAILEHEIGVLVAPPGSGKTVVGIRLIAERRRNTLVLVHRSQLLDQWRAQLGIFLGLDPKEIGQIGGGKRRATGAIDVAMIQSLARREDSAEVLADYGHVLVDECHHVPAASFEKVMNAVPARFVTGLTATPRRRDGHHPILGFQLGPVRYAVDPRRHASQRGFEHRLVVRDTSFRSELAAGGIQEIYGSLSRDTVRNELILDDVVTAIEAGRSPVVLTERKEHLAYLAGRLRSFVRHLIVLQGGMRPAQRREIANRLSSIPDGEERLLLATGRFLGEGFDDARLDTLFLTMPVSWRGTLVQYAGRLHRSHRGKKEVRIYDYVDRQVPMLVRMFEKRMRGYAAMGYRVSE